MLNSVSNLMGFRWIAEKVEAGALALHGWWFNMTEGQLYAFNPQTAAFEAVHGIKVQPTVVKGTTLSDINPETFISAVAGRKPAFCAGRAPLQWRVFSCSSGPPASCRLMLKRPAGSRRSGRP